MGGFDDEDAGGDDGEDVEREDVEREDVEREDVEREDVEREDVEREDVEREDVEREDVEDAVIVGDIPDLEPYVADPGQEYLRHMDAFADVLAFARSQRYSSVFGDDDAFTLLRGKETVLYVDRDSWVEEPLKTARNLLLAILEDLP